MVPEQVTPRSMEVASNPSLHSYDQNPRQHLCQPFPGLHQPYPNARHHPRQPPPGIQRPPAPCQLPPNFRQHPQASGMYVHISTDQNLLTTP